MAAATFSVRIPLDLEAKLASFSACSGQSRGKIVSLALADRFSRTMFLYEPKAWLLDGETWQVEAMEPVVDGLVRFYGQLFGDADSKPRPMSAMLSLEGITMKSSMVDILNAKWISMRRD